MSAILIRKELHEMIDIADDRLVAALYVMLQSLIQDEGAIIGSTTSGQQITKEDLIARVRQAYDEGKHGNVKSKNYCLAC